MKFISLLLLCCMPILALRNQVPEHWKYKGIPELESLRKFDEELFWDVLQGVIISRPEIVAQTKQFSDWMMEGEQSGKLNMDEIFLVYRGYTNDHSN